MTHSTTITFDKQKWMSNVLDIDRLKLTDICLARHAQCRHGQKSTQL